MDMDGSMADYDKAMKEGLLKLMAPGEELPDDPFAARREFPHWKHRMKLIKMQTGFWSGLDPVDIGMQLYRMFLHNGFHVSILTKGPSTTPHAWTEKLLWAREHMPEAVVTVTEDSKSHVEGDVLYDDWPDYVDPWLRADMSRLAIMRTTKYNEGYEHQRLFRVYDWPAHTNWPGLWDFLGIL